MLKITVVVEFVVLLLLLSLLSLFICPKVSIIGTGMRGSSRSAFGRSTGNDVSDHYKRHYFLFFLFSFFFFFSFLFSVVYFSHRRSARIKKLI